MSEPNELAWVFLYTRECLIYACMVLLTTVSELLDIINCHLSKTTYKIVFPEQSGIRDSLLKKKKILPIFSPLCHLKPLWLSTVEYKGRYFEKCLSDFSSIRWKSVVFNIYLFVKVIQGSNDMKVSKWWRNVHLFDRKDQLWHVNESCIVSHNDIKGLLLFIYFLLWCKSLRTIHSLKKEEKHHSDLW